MPLFAARLKMALSGSAPLPAADTADLPGLLATGVELSLAADHLEF